MGTQAGEAAEAAEAAEAELAAAVRKKRAVKDHPRPRIESGELAEVEMGGVEETLSSGIEFKTLVSCNWWVFFKCTPFQIGLKEHNKMNTVSFGPLVGHIPM